MPWLFFFFLQTTTGGRHSATQQLHFLRLCFLSSPDAWHKSSYCCALRLMSAEVSFLFFVAEPRVSTTPNIIQSSRGGGRSEERRLQISDTRFSKSSPTAEKLNRFWISGVTHLFRRRVVKCLSGREPVLLVWKPREARFRGKKKTQQQPKNLLGVWGSVEAGYRWPSHSSVSLLRALLFYVWLRRSTATLWQRAGQRRECVTSTRWIPNDTHAVHAKSSHIQ